jgi:hypothetical protein
MIWIVLTPLSALGLLCVLVARKYTLNRNVVRAGEQTRPGSGGSGSGSEKKVEEAETTSEGGKPEEP